MHQPQRPIARLIAGLSIVASSLVTLGIAGCDDFGEEHDDLLAEAPLEDTPLDEALLDEAPLGEAPLDEAPLDEPTEDQRATDPAPIQGHLDKRIIQRIVRAHINEIKHCYNQLLSENSTAAGRLEVRFSIDALGSVSNATIADGTLDDPQLRSCVSSAVERWKFPKPEGGGKVIVSYPFNFDPA